MGAMSELDPAVEAEKISDRVAKLAFDRPEADRNAFIASIIVGQSTWSEATRGMARAKVGLMTIDAMEVKR